MQWASCWLSEEGLQESLVENVKMRMQRREIEFTMESPLFFDEQECGSLLSMDLSLYGFEQTYAVQVS
jgi:hypothetical protein